MINSNTFNILSINKKINPNEKYINEILQNYNLKFMRPLNYNTIKK